MFTDDERLRIKIDAAAKILAGMLANPNYSLTSDRASEYEKDAVAMAESLAENLLDQCIPEAESD